MPDEPAANADAARSKKKAPKILIIVVGVAVVEAALFFGAIKIFGGGPQTSYGDNQHVMAGEEADPDASPVEVELLRKFRVPNSKKGRTFIYDFDVSVTVLTSRLEDMEKLVKERSGEIADLLAQIVRAADPKDLDEADLRTLKLKFKTAIGEIAQDEELVKKVLIPRWTPVQAG